MPRQVDETFTALPLRPLADAALQRARELGAEHADFRIERVRSQYLRLRDGRPETAHDGEDTGFAVRVVHDGSWGFASAAELSPDAVVKAAQTAVELAQLSA